ncbi:unnamed protein product, partial [Ectocarpus sp. 8 AP-2014]
GWLCALLGRTRLGGLCLVYPKTGLWCVFAGGLRRSDRGFHSGPVLLVIRGYGASYRSCCGTVHRGCGREGDGGAEEREGKMASILGARGCWLEFLPCRAGDKSHSKRYHS